METKQGYNGWASYETWNVMLWLQSDENLYRMACQLVDYTKGKLTIKQAKPAVRRMFATLFTWYNDYSSYCHMTETPNNVMLNSKVIDWQEIVDALNDWYRA
jgi:hypothetical protein